MILKRLFCKHNYVWQHNFYGDYIRLVGWKRSLWKCAKCGKREFRDSLGGKE